MKLLFLFIFSGLLSSVIAKEIPRLQGPVMDQANLLSPSEKKQLSHALFELRDRTGVQFQFFSIKSLEDESLEGYSIKVTDEWKLGSEKEDKGLLLLVALKDKKMRLEVGQGLEGVLTDFKSSQIINSMKPYFRNGDYSGGVFSVFATITKELGHKIPNSLQSSAKRRRSLRSRSLSLPRVIFYIIFILIFLFGGRGGRGGYYRSSRSYGGWSSGGSSGGWSGGGGGFSGGGASGSW